MASIVTSVVSSLAFEDTGSGNAESLTGAQVSPITIEDTSDTLTLGNKIDKRIGARHVIRGTVHINGTGTNGFGHLGTGQDLYAAMLAGTEKRLVITWQGASSYDVWTYDPVLLVLTPRIGTTDQNKNALLVHDDGSGTPPAGYTNLGDVLGGTSPQFEAITVPDGQGRGIYARLRMTWQPQLVDMAQTGAVASADSDSDELVKIAIAHGTSPETYTEIDDVVFSELLVPTDEFAVVQLALGASWRDPRGDSKIIWPSSPPNYLFGFDFVAIASGQQVSDFLTVS